MTLARTLFFFLVFWAHQLLILPLLAYFMVRSRYSGDPGVRRTVCGISRTWGRLMCALGGARITVRDDANLPPGEAVLFVSNHQGDFDIPVLLAHGGRNLAFIAKKELAWIPLIAQWMGLMGCIFLDRDDRRKQVAQIKTAIDHLQSGLSMVIFPEGTRSHGPEMAPFAPGSLNIAVKAGVRIVPVTLKDTYTLKPKDRFGLPGGEAAVVLHPPIDTADLDREGKEGLNDRVKAIIQQGLDAE